MMENLTPSEKDNANFSALRSAIFEGRYEDVPELLDVKAITDFVEGDVEVRDEVLYYKGKHRLHGVVVDKLLDMLRSGMKDSTPITNYIGRLMNNPSSNSVDELYTFLGYRSLPITPEGKVLGYKGVQQDFGATQAMPILLLFKVKLMIVTKSTMESVKPSKFSVEVAMTTRIIIVHMACTLDRMITQIIGQEAKVVCFL